MRFFILLAVFAAAFSLPASAVRAAACEGASRMVIECEAFMARGAAKKEMTQVYEDLLAGMQTDQAKRHLKQAQAAWEVYMRSSCDFESVVWMSGSGTSARVMLCEAVYTKRRTAVLQDMLQCRTDDCPH